MRVMRGMLMKSQLPVAVDTTMAASVVPLSQPRWRTRANATGRSSGRATVYGVRLIVAQALVLALSLDGARISELPLPTRQASSRSQAPSLAGGGQ